MTLHAVSKSVSFTSNTGRNHRGSVGYKQYRCQVESVEILWVVNRGWDHAAEICLVPLGSYLGCLAISFQI
jgi:hypothetical protein